MMKKLIIFFIIPTLFIVSCSSDQGGKQYDTQAVANLDNLSELIGNLNSCSYTLNVINAKSKDSVFTNEHDVYMRGPDKMHITSNGRKGLKAYWYDGKQFSCFTYNKNIYDTVDAPANIIAAIDFLHDKYGIDFPAADFFYPRFTDDIIDNYNHVLMMDDETIDQVDCAVIEASNDNEFVQIWIEKATKLPYKLIIGKTGDSNNYYEAIFSNWEINPNLPDVLFKFTPPENATRVELQVKNN
ncbi:MAG: hypothetical protein DRJ10_02370 [Bacteroidetes bacterium]|nr:MAG: hypothetical protein DRJ10_02370 [Bacteroidota bacterium]